VKIPRAIQKHAKLESFVFSTIEIIHLIPINVKIKEAIKAVVKANS
jgi:hypothetical protein